MLTLLVVGYGHFGLRIEALLQTSAVFVGLVAAKMGTAEMTP